MKRKQLLVSYAYKHGQIARLCQFVHYNDLSSNCIETKLLEINFHFVSDRCEQNKQELQLIWQIVLHLAWPNFFTIVVFKGTYIAASEFISKKN